MFRLDISKLCLNRNVKKLKAIVFILMLLVAMSGCLDKPKLDIEIEDVTVHQTGECSTVIYGGEEVGIKPGILFVSMTASFKNTGESTIKLKNSDIILKNYEKELDYLSLKLSNGKEVNSLSIPPKQTIPVQISATWSDGPPFKLQLLVLNELIDLENIPPQNNRFSVSLNSDVVVNQSSVRIDDFYADSLMFSLNIKNNGRINWIVDETGDIFEPKDSKSSSYAFAATKSGCPSFSIGENEEKSVEFVYITKNMYPGLKINLRSPFEGTIEIPKNRIKIYDKTK